LVHWISNCGRYTIVYGSSMLRRSSHRLFAALALPVLAAALLLSSSALQRCVGDGIARVACCCNEQASSTPSPNAHVGERCCCDAVVAGPAIATRLEGIKAGPDARPLLAALPGEVPRDNAISAFIWAAERERSPRPPAVPLFLLKRVFLI